MKLKSREETRRVKKNNNIKHTKRSKQKSNESRDKKNSKEKTERKTKEQSKRNHAMDMQYDNKLEIKGYEKKEAKDINQQ